MDKENENMEGFQKEEPIQESANTQDNRNVQLNRVSCPSCGGVVDITEDQDLATCPFCRHQLSVTKESLDFTIDRGVLLRYNGDSNEVEVPVGVRAIGTITFAYQNNLTKIVLPEGVNELQGGFMDCSNLETIIFPDSLKFFPEWTFKGCASLKSITLPKNLIELGSGAFEGCRKLTSIEIPPTVEVVKSNAFNNCESLETICCYENTKFEMDRFQSFLGCDNLSGIYVLDSKTGELLSKKRIVSDEDGYSELVEDESIPDKSFKSLIMVGKNENVEKSLNEDSTQENTLARANEDFKLNETTCPSCGGIVEVSEGEVLANCPFCRNQFSVIEESKDFTIENGVLLRYNGEDTEVEVPSGVKAIGSSAFTDQRTLKKIILPDGVNELPDSCFWGCSSLETIILPDSLEYFPQLTFRECVSLKSIVLPKNLKDLGEGAFDGCKNLTSVEIPPTVESVEKGAFYDCESLETIICYENTKFTGSYFNGCGSLTSIKVLDSKTGETISKKRIKTDEDGDSDIDGDYVEEKRSNSEKSSKVNKFLKGLFGD